MSKTSLILFNIFLAAVVAAIWWVTYDAKMGVLIGLWFYSYLSLKDEIRNLKNKP